MNTYYGVYIEGYFLGTSRYYLLLKMKIDQIHMVFKAEVGYFSASSFVFSRRAGYVLSQNQTKYVIKKYTHT